MGTTPHHLGPKGKIIQKSSQYQLDVALQPQLENIASDFSTTNLTQYVLIVYDKLLNPRKAGKDSGNPSPTVSLVYDKLLKPRKAGKDSGNPSPTVSLAEKLLERTKNAGIVATTLKANELNRDFCKL